MNKETYSWNRIASLEIESSTHGNLICNKNGI